MNTNSYSSVLFINTYNYYKYKCRKLNSTNLKNWYVQIYKIDWYKFTKLSGKKFTKLVCAKLPFHMVWWHYNLWHRYIIYDVVSFWPSTSGALQTEHFGLAFRSCPFGLAPAGRARPIAKKNHWTPSALGQDPFLRADSRLRTCGPQPTCPRMCGSCPVLRASPACSCNFDKFPLPSTCLAIYVDLKVLEHLCF